MVLFVLTILQFEIVILVLIRDTIRDRDKRWEKRFSWICAGYVTDEMVLNAAFNYVN